VGVAYLDFVCLCALAEVGTFGLCGGEGAARFSRIGVGGVEGAGLLGGSGERPVGRGEACLQLHGARLRCEGRRALVGQRGGEGCVGRRKGVMLWEGGCEDEGERR